MSLIEITTGMSKAAEMIDGNFKSLSKPVYNEYPITLNGFTGTLKVVKIGNIVNLSGEYLGTGVGVVRGKFLHYLPDDLRPVSRIPIQTTVHPQYSSQINEKYSFLMLYETNGGLAIELQSEAGLKFLFNTTYIVK